MNKTVTKNKNKVQAVDGGLLITTYPLRILWHAPGVYGNGEHLDIQEFKQVVETVAFKKGEPVREGDTITFTYGKATVRVPLDGETSEVKEIPKPGATAPWDPKIMGVWAVTNGPKNLRYVRFEPERIVGTDTIRIHCLETSVPVDEPVHIYRGDVKTISEINPKRYGFVDGGIYAKGDDWEVWAPGHDVNYPDYEHAIPKEFLKPEVRLLLDRWRDAIKIAEHTAKEGFITITKEGSVEHENIKIGGVFTATPGRIRVLGKHLLDALEFIGDDSKILYTDAEKSMMVRVMIRGEDACALLPVIKD